MIGLLFAALAILGQPQPIPADFTADMGSGHEVIVIVGEASSLTSEPGATPQTSVEVGFIGWSGHAVRRPATRGLDATWDYRLAPSSTNVLLTRPAGPETVRRSPPHRAGQLARRKGNHRMAHLSLSTGTYDAAKARLGKRDTLIIGHNTLLIDKGTDGIAVRLHSTDVLTFTRDGWTVIRTNGWETPTTRDRVNALLPQGWHVGGDGKGYRGRGWGLYRTPGWARVADFADGIAVRQDPSDIVVGMAPQRWSTAGIEVIRSSGEVETIVAKAEDDKAARDAKRAARLARQHEGEVDIAEVRNAGDKVLAALDAGRTPLALHVHAFEAYTAGPHNGRTAWDCPQCSEREAVAREYRRGVLSRQHDIAQRLVGVTGPPTWDEVERLKVKVGDPWLAAGSHLTRDHYTGNRGPSGLPLAKVTCPWDCPKARR